MTNTYCVYAVLRYSWWWTVDLSETCKVLYQINFRNSASCWLLLQESISASSSHLHLRLPSSLLRCPSPKSCIISLLSHMCHMPRPPHPSWLHYPKNIRWRYATNDEAPHNILSSSCYFLTYRPEYIPQQPTVEYSVSFQISAQEVQERLIKLWHKLFK